MATVPVPITLTVTTRSMATVPVPIKLTVSTRSMATVPVPITLTVTTTVVWHCIICMSVFNVWFTLDVHLNIETKDEFLFTLNLVDNIVKETFDGRYISKESHASVIQI
jgi:hypothetical protein